MYRTLGQESLGWGPFNNNFREVNHKPCIVYDKGTLSYNLVDCNSTEATLASVIGPNEQSGYRCFTSLFLDLILFGAKTGAEGIESSSADNASSLLLLL